MHTSLTETRIRNRRGQGERLRHELIAAAARLLAAPPADEPLALRAVAREAGVAPQSVYLHFADKGEIVQALIEHCFAELTRVGREAEARVEDPFAKLRARSLAYCEFGLQHPGYYKLLFESRATGQLEPPQFAGSPGARTFEDYLDVVKRCLAAGDGRPDDPILVTASLWAGLHGIVSLRLNKPGFPWPSVEDLVDRLLSGLVGVSG